MAVLLLAEVNGGTLNADATAKALTGVSSLGDVTILCASSGCEGAAEEAAKLAGVSKVLCCSDEAYGHDLAEPVAEGNAIQTVKSSDATKVMTVRTAGFDAAADGGSASVEKVAPVANSGLSSWVEDKTATSDRPELTSAGVVVSGGRGVGSEDDFKIIEALADKSPSASLARSSTWQA